MRARLQLEPVAEEDIAEHFERLNNVDQSLGRRFLKATRETFEFLQDNPGAGAFFQIDNPKIRTVRSWRVKGFNKYVVFYRHDAHAVVIVRVLYGTRDLPTLLALEL